MKIRCAIEKIRSDHYELHVSYRQSWWFWSDWQKLDVYYSSEKDVLTAVRSLKAGNFIINRYGTLYSAIDSDLLAEFPTKGSV